MSHAAVSLKLTVALTLIVSCSVSMGTWAQDSSPRPARPRQAAKVADSQLSFEPAIVDFGELMVGEEVKATVTVTNVSEKSIHITRAIPSCVCTVPRMSKNKLDPGEAMEVDLLFKGKREGESSVYIRFLLADNSLVSLQTKAKVSPIVTFEPKIFDADFKEDVTLKITSNDGVPFGVISSNPRVLAGLTEEPALEHEIVISAELGRQLERVPALLRLYLDHPKKQSIVLRSNKILPAENMRRMITWASGYGELADLIKLIDDGADINETDQRGMTYLMHASSTGETERVQALIDAGAEVTAVRNDKRTALMNAALTGNLDTVTVLLAAGADVNAADKYGRTALHWSARSGDVDRVKSLLKHGAKVDVLGPFNETPLMYSVRSKDLQRVRIIVEAGADVSIVNEKGKTALDQARDRLKFAREKDQEAIEAIIDYLKRATTGS